MKTLYICSTGMEVYDISLKTIEIIKKSDILVSNIYSEEVLKKLKPESYFFINKKSENNSALESVIIKEIKTLFKKFNNIVFLTDGNPLFLNLISLNIYSYFSAQKIKVFPIPAISSFDYVINIIMKKFRIAKFEFFICFYPSNLLKYDISKIKNCIIFNINSLNRSGEREKDDFIAFFLKKFSKSKYFYVVSYDPINSKEIIFKYRIKNIRKFINNSDPKTTIFIP